MTSYRVEIMRRRRLVRAWRWRLVRPWGTPPPGPARPNPARVEVYPRLPWTDRADVVAEGWAWTRGRAIERARWAQPEAIELDDTRTAPKRPPGPPRPDPAVAENAGRRG